MSTEKATNHTLQIAVYGKDSTEKSSPTGYANVIPKTHLGVRRSIILAEQMLCGFIPRLKHFVTTTEVILNLLYSTWGFSIGHPNGTIAFHSLLYRNGFHPRLKAKWYIISQRELLEGESVKRLGKVKGVECMACMSCVFECSYAFYKELNEYKSCIQLVTKKGEPAPSFCVQCGKCAKACTHEAITQNAKGIYLINKKKCVGCGDCVEACPLHLIVMPAETASKCIVCGKCVKGCPMGYLEIVESE